MPLMHQVLFEKADWYEACLAQRAQELGYAYIPVPLAQLIKHMARGVPARIALLAERIGVTRRRISQVAAEGVKQGVLELVADADDKRVLLVRMSPAGQQMADAAIASMHRIEAELARRIGRRQLETLIALLALDWGPAAVHDAAPDRADAQPGPAANPPSKPPSKPPSRPPSRRPATPRPRPARKEA
jgi:DNA-binding MarR family transcriptional regulator